MINAQYLELDTAGQCLLRKNILHKVSMSRLGTPSSSSHSPVTMASVNTKLPPVPRSDSCTVSRTSCGPITDQYPATVTNHSSVSVTLTNHSSVFTCVTSVAGKLTVKSWSLTDRDSWPMRSEDCGHVTALHQSELTWPVSCCTALPSSATEAPLIMIQSPAPLLYWKIAHYLSIYLSMYVHQVADNLNL